MPDEELTQSNDSSKRRRIYETESAKHIDTEQDSSNISEAAIFNQRVLKKLQRAISKNPEIDLLSQFPSDYSSRLNEKIDVLDLKENVSIQSNEHERSESDIRSRIQHNLPAEVVYSLSPSVRSLLMTTEHAADDTVTPKNVIDFLSRCEIVYCGPTPEVRSVFKFGSKMIVKVIWDIQDYTEYTTLEFIHQCITGYLAPKPLGVLRIGRLSFIFTSYLPGQSLEEVWPGLTTDQKLSIQDQLQKSLTKLRSIEYDSKMPLGGVQGEGCKDFRRNLRLSKGPIYNTEQYDDFLFSNVRFGSQFYLEFLRQFTLRTSKEICFSHGDFRPANIIVQEMEPGKWTLTGLIDWEFSGFYPCHYESTKATNCLSTDETSDWYKFLPECLSPETWSQRWLLDYLLGQLLE